MFTINKRIIQVTPRIHTCFGLAFGLDKWDIKDVKKVREWTILILCCTISIKITKCLTNTRTNEKSI